MAISRATLLSIILLMAMSCMTCFRPEGKLDFFEGEDIDEDNVEIRCREDGESNQECIPGGNGYFYCNSRTYRLQIHRCEAPKSKCRCPVRSFWGLDFCECVSSRETPPFPETGIIRWNGKESQNEYFDEDIYQSVTISGERRKDKSGRFFKNETRFEFHPWLRDEPKRINEITIINRNNDGSFTKYSRKGNSKTCIIENQDTSEALLPLEGWAQPTLPYFWAMDSESVKKRGITTQVWKRGYSDEDHSWKKTMVVEYDVHRNMAIPKSYTEEGDGQFFDKISKKNYEYIPFNDGYDIKINIKDYCQ